MGATAGRYTLQWRPPAPVPAFFSGIKSIPPFPCTSGQLLSPRPSHSASTVLQPIVDGQQPTVDSQQSTANSQQSTANSQQSTVNNQQPTVNSQQSTVSSQQSAVGRQSRSTVNSQQSTVNSRYGQQSIANSQHAQHYHNPRCRDVRGSGGTRRSYTTSTAKTLASKGV